MNPLLPTTPKIYGTLLAATRGCMDFKGEHWCEVSPGQVLTVVGQQWRIGHDVELVPGGTVPHKHRAGIFVQWKGVSAFMDWTCPCGVINHVRAKWHMYKVACACGRHFGVALYVEAIAVSTSAEATPPVLTERRS